MEHCAEMGQRPLFRAGNILENSKTWALPSNSNFLKKTCLPAHFKIYIHDSVTLLKSFIQPPGHWM